MGRLAMKKKKKKNQAVRMNISTTDRSGSARCASQVMGGEGSEI
jgi:hypothetical protein